MLRQIRAGSPEAIALLDRSTRFEDGVDDAVAAILRDVRMRGDEAVAQYTRQFDGREPPYEVTRARWDELAAKVEPRVRHALELAAHRIRAFHERQIEPDVDVTMDGVRLELRVTPLRRVGLYVPGGTARYPSSVLMTAIPAKVAGVPEVIMVTPGASPEALLAARLANVDRVFELGGAQAVGALAYGTQAVPRVDKIVGPGNAWVASAKRQVYGEVDIDSIAGPSEVLIIGDAEAPAAWLAADLLAQAEHDREARAILVTTSAELGAAVAKEVAVQLATLPRKAIAQHSISHHGAVVLVDSLDDAIAFANQYAPEHLELDVVDARRVATRCTTAGAIFIGRWSSEAAGDYVAGANHVLPTGGAARYASPLGVHDFRKRTSLIEYSQEAALAHADEIAVLAACEGLDAHGRSALRRKDKA
jgi:histidinol dehydrogenase